MVAITATVSWRSPIWELAERTNRALRESRPVAQVLRRAALEAYHVARATTATHRRLRDHLTAIVVATLGVDLICALIAFLTERHAQQTEVKSFGGALFWTSTQLLTVSSSVKNPISSGARVLDVFMEIWAITVIATLAGAMGSFLQKRGEELAKPDSIPVTRAS